MFSKIKKLVADIMAEAKSDDGKSKVPKKKKKVSLDSTPATKSNSEKMQPKLEKKVVASTSKSDSDGSGGSSSDANKYGVSGSGINYEEAESTMSGGGKTNFAERFAGRAGASKTLAAGPKSSQAKVAPIAKKPTVPAATTDNEGGADESKAAKAAKDPSLVYLVRGKDRNREAWHYVLVKRNLLPIFLKHTKGGTVDVAKFGDILFSGWGKDPPQDIIDKIDRCEY